MVQSGPGPANEALAKKRKGIREAHHQRISLVDAAQAPKKPDIKNIQLIAFVDFQSFKWTNHGTLQITLLIPPEFLEDALQLRWFDEFPCSIDFQKWTPAVIAEGEVTGG